MYAKASVAAFLFTSLPSAINALGSATVKNQCSSDVYLWTVNNTPGAMQTIQAGGEYTQEYQLNSDGGGISMKISTTPDDSGAITQYEYTIDGMLWYDISNINGYPFKDTGLTLTPSDSSCRTVSCPAGVELCSAAYNTPDENQATAACGTDADTTLVLCSNNKGSAPVSSPKPVVQASSSPASSSAASPVAHAAQVAEPATSAVESPSVVKPATPIVDTPATSAAPVTTPAAQVQVAAQPSAGVHTTFVTAVVTVVAGGNAAPATTAAANVDDAVQDWNFAHHPASLGADWGFANEKRHEMHEMHKRAAHRHHFHRHVGDSN